MNLKSIQNKEVRKVARRFRDAGCDLSFTGSGHIAIRKGGALIAVLPRSPSDHRSLKNVMRDARRMGIDL